MAKSYSYLKDIVLMQLYANIHFEKKKITFMAIVGRINNAHQNKHLFDLVMTLIKAQLLNFLKLASYC
jgi:hypothetical protein